MRIEKLHKTINFYKRKQSISFFPKTKNECPKLFISFFSISLISFARSPTQSNKCDSTYIQEKCRTQISLKNKQMEKFGLLLWWSLWLLNYCA